ncbi:propionyl-CoA synthetase [Pandoraea iniqua]|uniref:Propionate--CoA ligase n=1 Tax=Pandoraea iniqua TaxID=2508288 RepID=A0A5E4Y082_9BURK|nr:propionate--CoA ligase [Pandoraea iniqua]VVE41893.1 propionyl-CoA synthetase [Pandoraea iniqua]
MDYSAFYRESIESPEAFWTREAYAIDWHRPFDAALYESEPEFPHWFPGGQLNLCHNAVDRHLPNRADQPALVWYSTEVQQERVFTFAQLHEEVQGMAAVLSGSGVRKGDRVLIYLPMIPEAAIAMLACARLGAIHSVVFGGFASTSLTTRIEDSQPRVIVTADAGSRDGKVIAYKPLLDRAIELSEYKPQTVLLVDRGLAPATMVAGRDIDYRSSRCSLGSPVVPCEWVDSAHPSYILYTSGTTGRPKGVQRDTGGYAVALAASMRHIYLGEPGEAFFATSDVGWVVGHSYIIYGPLIAGMTSILYEGLPTRPDASVWWRLVERFRVRSMFSSPTAIRVLRKEGPDGAQKHDLSSLKALYLAGEPLDEVTSQWIHDALGVPVVDNYWQTETGWPILSIALNLDERRPKAGSAGVPIYGFDVVLIDEASGKEVYGAGQKGVVAIKAPLPPGCMQTVWRDDDRYVKTYWRSIPGRTLYSTFDWGTRDEDGYFFILGRTDDVINVAGHRIGTRELEACIASHPSVAEVAVVGVADGVKGQVPLAFATLKDGDDGELSAKLKALVATELGAIARPSSVHFVAALPKTRSGKLLRRALQAVAEGRDPGDLSTLENPHAMVEVARALRER